MPPKPIVPITFLVLLLATGCAAAAERVRAESSRQAQIRTSFELGPGVIIEGHGPMTFVMRPSGGIEAVDAQSGKSVWSTNAAAKPLALLGSRLVAQAEATLPGVLPIVVFDTRDADTPALTTEVPLPAEVFAFIDQPLGRFFAAQARADGGEVVVLWNYLEQEVTGVAPAPGTSPVRRRFEGGARVDVATGEIHVLEGASTPASPLLPPPVQHMVENRELRQPPWRAGRVLAATTERETEDGRRWVVLRRWDAETGEALPEVVLFEGRPRALLPSADSQHVVITSRLEGAEAPAWERYRWSVYSLASGEVLGELRWHTSATPFCVLDGTLLTMTQPFGRLIEGRIVEQPLALRAVSLDSGAQTWSRPVHDTTYRGPHPPGP